MKTMNIGECARRAGVSVDTVRFYERRGLLPKATRRPSGYRVYSAVAVERIVGIKSLQSLGLSLDEVRSALEMLEEDGVTCEAERWRLENVRTRLDAKIAALQATRAALTRALGGCDAGSCELIARAR